MFISAPSIGWLRQEAISGSKRTVYAEAVSEMEVTAFGAEFKEAEAALIGAQTGSAEEVVAAQRKYDEAAERFEGAGGYQVEQRVTEVLSGLGFALSDFQRPCSELSGGWQMRVALARALLRDPELLLLDEPTNHMDASAKRWLASHLANGLSPRSTLLLVTHDRSLLEDIRCSSVIEIAEKRILQYSCKGIADWERSRTSRTEGLAKQIKTLEKEISIDKEFVQKWGAKASHASLAQSRKKKIARAEEELKQLRDATVGLPAMKWGRSGTEGSDGDAAVEGILPLSGFGRVSLKLPDAPLAASPPSGGALLSLHADGEGAQVGYGTGTPIVSGVRISVRQGTRLALLGPNGCGKTTLLRTLAGDMPVRAGLRRVGVGGLRRARVAYFTQDLAQDLPAASTPVDYVLKDAPIQLDKQGARQALGALGLRSEVHNSKIGTLSGGEKARVALAVFMTRPADVLLLDEPTNHLDGAAVAALSAGLREHTAGQGSVVVASHDKAFIDALEITTTVKVAPGQAGMPGSVQVTEGSPEGQLTRARHQESLMGGGAMPTAAAESTEKAALGGGRFTSAEVKEARHNAARLLTKIERKEQKLARAENKMNEAYSEKTFEKYEALRKEVETLYEEWEQVEEVAQTSLVDAL